MSVQEYRRNQILLNLARSIFEEQNNLECLVTKILTEARELLKCERCTVFLLDLDCCESVSCVGCDMWGHLHGFNFRYQNNLVWLATVERSFCFTFFYINKFRIDGAFCVL